MESRATRCEGDAHMRLACLLIKTRLVRRIPRKGMGSWTLHSSLSYGCRCLILDRGTRICINQLH